MNSTSSIIQATSPINIQSASRINRMTSSSSKFGWQSPEFSVNKTSLHHVCLMLDHRLRRWANIKPTFDQRLVFTSGIIFSIRSPIEGLCKQHSHLQLITVIFLGLLIKCCI